MKIYKKYHLLFFMNFLTIITFLISLVYFNNINYNEYIKLDSIYVLDNTVKMIVDNKQLENIQKNKFIYLNSEKSKIKIISITKNIYIRRGINYHEVLLNIYNINEKTDLNISIYNKKKSYITIFKDCWKEE